MAWNSSALYIGGAMGTFALARTPLGGPGFVMVAVVGVIGFGIALQWSRHARDPT